MEGNKVALERDLKPSRELMAQKEIDIVKSPVDQISPSDTKIPPVPVDIKTLKELRQFIKKNYENNGIVIDPHTAIGVGAAKKLSIDNCIVLSTAHPCKFPDAIMSAINKHEKLPNELQYLLNKNENFVKLKNNTEIVKQFIKKMIL